MRIAAAHIIYDNWIRDMRNVDERLKLLKEIISKGNKIDPIVDLLVLPAGYIMCKKVTDCQNNANKLIQSLPKHHPDLIFGIDCRRTDTDYEKSRTDSPPYFAYKFSSKKKEYKNKDDYIRQQGTGSDSKVEKLKIDSSKRCLNVKGKKIGIIVCGEMTSRVKGEKYQPRLPVYLVGEKKLDLIVDIAHADRLIKPLPRSWYPAMKATGKPCVLSQHIHRDYLSDKRFCKSEKLGPNYSYLLKKPFSICEKKYIIQIYDFKTKR